MQKRKNIEETEKFSRQCYMSGEGMNEGYYIECLGLYIKKTEDFLKYIKAETEYSSIEEAYEDEYYYWTDWHQDEPKFELINGVLTEIQIITTVKI